MSPESVPSSTQTELEKVTLELQKLKYEVRDISPREVLRPSFWFNVAAVVFGLAGLWLQWSAAVKSEAVAKEKQFLAEQDRNMAQGDLNEADALLENAKRTLEVNMTKHEEQLNKLDTLLKAPGPLTAKDVSTIRGELESSVKPVQELRQRIEKRPARRVFLTPLRPDAPGWQNRSGSD